MLSTVIAICLPLLGAAPEPATGNVEKAARAALETLPGKTAFVFAEITDEGPKPLFGVRADEDFAVGSSFKLWIFGTLADQVNTAHERLENTMLLERELQGPPHSEMAEWPVGSPVTLYTLALKMISISDNTATDHLIYLLGRRAIEHQMSVMGDTKPQLNLPLLTTREMAMLRDKSAGMPAREYNKLDEAGKRKFLAEHFSGTVDYDKLDFDTAAYDQAEWYAAPMDMARAMEWIYRHTTADKPAHLMRAILAIDPKLDYDRAKWKFVGFKGGSEAQLLAGNWLLESAAGKWYTFHVFYNNPTGKADPEALIKAVQAIFKAIEPTLEGEAKLP